MKIFFGMLLCSTLHSTEIPLYKKTMSEVETEVLSHSPVFKVAQEQSLSANEREQAQYALLYPRLSLDGSYRYQTEVPKFSPIPNAPATPFGDHRATSIGPTINWVLWDQGALRKNWRAQQARAKSQEEAENLTKTQVLFGARLAYIQLQLALEQVRLLGESTLLADARYADVVKRHRAGSASRIDLLSSHQEALNRRKEFLQAQAAAGRSLRELLQLTGDQNQLILTHPIDDRVSTGTPQGLPGPTVRVSLDNFNTVNPSLSHANTLSLNLQHPRILALQKEAAAEKYLAESAGAASWPKISLQARYSHDYPNGPVLKSVDQKSIGLTASLPLFEMGQTTHLKEGQQHQATAAQLRQQLAIEELSREWDAAQLTLQTLREQEEIDETSIKETTELERLVQLSYQSGTANYLEVQTAGLKALEAKVSAARTRAQILIQLATLAQLAETQG